MSNGKLQKRQYQTTNMPTSKRMVTNQHVVTTPHDSPHNIHRKPFKTMANDGSIWPSTCGR